MIRKLRCALAAAAALLAAGCDLAEVTTEPGDDVVVVEAVLRTDMTRQQVLLHRAMQGRFVGGVPGARITVTRADGRQETLEETSEQCARIDTAYATSDPLEFHGTCYLSPTSDTAFVRAGATYDLRVETDDGRVIRGRTHVPGAFATPSLPSGLGGIQQCTLAPGTGFALLWTRSAGAATYVADLRIYGLNGRLGPIGAPEPLELRGLAVSEADTTIVLPSEFGVFERFNYPNELLNAIQNGFPDGVSMELALAAADQNWVNSVRGGNFNPSGLIRISTVVGDGVGVFGSLVVKHHSIAVIALSALPRCGVH